MPDDKLPTRQAIAERITCLTSATPPSFVSTLAGPAVALDSLNASGRCPAALPRSNASAAFLRARAVRLSSHGLPIVAEVQLSEQISELHQACCHQKLAVARTAGRTGCKPGRRPAHRGMGGGRGSPGQIALGPVAGQNRGFDPQLQDPARIISACHSGAEIEILLAKNSEKPGLARCRRWKNYRGRE
jgi:hypothetical protein